MAQRGVPVTAAAAALGHDPAVFLRTYAHFCPGVSVKGTGFNGANNVLFGTVPASSFSVSSSTRITAVAPPETAGTVDVVVRTANGTSTTSSDDQFTYRNRSH